MNGAVEVVNKNVKKKYILIDTELDEAEWAEVKYEQLNLINKKG